MKSWLKYIAVLALLILGIFTPKISKACGQHAPKPALVSCAKKQEQHTPKKALHHTTSSEKGNQHQNCKDQCEHNTCDCVCAATYFGFPTFSTLATEQHFFELTKQQFGFKPAHCATGYFSIWHPPKIS